MANDKQHQAWLITDSENVQITSTVVSCLNEVISSLFKQYYPLVVINYAIFADILLVAIVGNLPVDMSPVMIHIKPTSAVINLTSKRP